MMRMLLCVLTIGVWFAHPALAETIHSDEAARGRGGDSVSGQQVVSSLAKDFGANGAADVALQVGLGGGQQLAVSQANAQALQQAMIFIRQYIQSVTVACLNAAGGRQNQATALFISFLNKQM